MAMLVLGRVSNLGFDGGPMWDKTMNPPRKENYEYRQIAWYENPWSLFPTTPPKINMSPENQWLEDVFFIAIVCF